VADCYERGNEPPGSMKGVAVRPSAFQHGLCSVESVRLVKKNCKPKF
jgi:hypothetical protein